MYLMGYVFINEVIGNILMEKGVNTAIINNLYAVITTLFFLVFYSFVFVKKSYKRASYIFIILYSIAILLNSFLFQNIFTSLQSYTFILGFFLVTITIILFFIEIMNSDKILVLRKIFLFWMSIGVLIFNLGLIPVLIVGELIRWDGIFHYIILFLNVIMYSCFIVGFIVSDKKYN